MTVKAPVVGEKEILEILERTGVLQEGHFVLTSGLHSNRYLQCARALQYPWESQILAQAIVERLGERDVDVVVGPAMGGITLAYEVARLLGVRGLFTERQEGRMTLRRGFVLKPDERVLVVEDVITTGGSVEEVIEVVETLGAKPIGVASLVDRSGGRADFGVPFTPLIAHPIETWKPEDCPLCRQGVPTDKPGSRAQHTRRH